MQFITVKQLRIVKCLKCTDASAAEGQDLLGQRGQCAALECSDKRVRIVVWCHEFVPDNSAHDLSHIHRGACQPIVHVVGSAAMWRSASFPERDTRQNLFAMWAGAHGLQQLACILLTDTNYTRDEGHTQSCHSCRAAWLQTCIGQSCVSWRQWVLACSQHFCVASQ